MKNNWTPDRPTKSGKYWLSVHPEIRTSNGMRIPHTLLVEVDSGGSVEAEGCSDWSHLLDPMLDGALWRPYVEPPDPFAEPVPKLVMMFTTEERQNISSALHAMASWLRKFAECNPGEAGTAIRETDRMDAVNARICTEPSLRERVEALPRWKAALATDGRVHLFMDGMGDVYKVSEVLSLFEVPQ